MNKDNTVAQAGGFIIQLMPFTSDEIIEKLEENIKNLPSVTTMLSEGKTPEQILETVLAGFDVTFHETVDAGFVAIAPQSVWSEVCAVLGMRTWQTSLRMASRSRSNVSSATRHTIIPWTN